MKALIGCALMIVGSAAGFKLAFFLWEALTTRHNLAFPAEGLVGICLAVYGYSLTYENQPNNNHRP